MVQISSPTKDGVRLRHWGRGSSFGTYSEKLSQTEKKNLLYTPDTWLIDTSSYVQFSKKTKILSLLKKCKESMKENYSDERINMNIGLCASKFYLIISSTVFCVWNKIVFKFYT